MHDITWRHEILGALIDLGPEAADQMFIEVAHYPVGHHIRVKIDPREILANLEQKPSLIQPDHRIGKVELVEDDSGVVRKVGNVVLKVLPGFGSAKRTQCVFRGVVERESCALAQDQIDVNAGILVERIGIPDILPGGLQHAFQTP